MKTEMGKAVQENPQIGRIALANQCGVSVRAARNFLQKLRSGDGEPASEHKASVRVRSLTEFRKANDIPEKIRRQIVALRDGYVTEEELRQLCEVPVQNWRRNADLPEFSDNKFKLEGVTYWARRETIKQMKQITGRA